MKPSSSGMFNIRATRTPDRRSLNCESSTPGWGWGSTKRRLLLYIRTISYLKPQQVVFWVWHKLSLSSTMRLGCSTIASRKDVRLLWAPMPARPSGSDVDFRFLNVAKPFELCAIDWKSEDMPKLWRYNLHYFDYLLDDGRELETRKQIVSHWIANNPPGTKDAWEPYTVSLRIVNWVKFLLRESITVQSEWLNSLYLQAGWLEKNIEYHLLANHYLKNGKALFFAGVFFNGQDAERWLQKGLRILIEEAEEQFLTDGGHYERSPMYHSICLEDYLDVLNLIKSNPGLVSQDVLSHLLRNTNAALDFLQDICLPDGEIPLFNDSAIGIAPAPVRLFEYARQLTGYEPTLPPKNLTSIQKSHSGYFVARHGQDMMIIDCGPVGPDYQPGHAHCDTLSYELALDGQRVIVDSGVYDYEFGARRRYARSTKGHNTVSVDGEEQSEIWGKFRIARRAKPIGKTVAQVAGNGFQFEGRHDGYSRLPGCVIHKRVIEYDGCGRWTVLDEMTGSGTHEAESYIHLHPSCFAKKCQDGVEIFRRDGRMIGRLKVMGNASMRFEVGRYFPEFGREYENEVIVLACSGMLPVEFGYQIIKEF